MQGASSTQFTTGALWDTGVTSALYLANAAGKATAYGGATCANQFIRSLNGAGAATCATVANTDLANSSLTVSAGAGLSGGGSVSLGGSTSLSLNLGNGNSWAALQQFTNASTSLFSAYGPAYFGGTASSSFGTDGKLTLTGITSSILLTNGTTS
jgi:hypothetical protein